MIYKAEQAILEDLKDSPSKQIEFIKLMCADEENPFYEAYQRDKAFIEWALRRDLIYFKSDFYEEHHEHILDFRVIPLSDRVCFYIQSYKKQTPIEVSKPIEKCLEINRMNIEVKLSFICEEIKEGRKVNIVSIKEE